QNFKLIQNNTVLENVSIPLVYAGLGAQARKTKVSNTLHDVGLYNKENLAPNQLSGGQQQRVAIERAIINNPKFIIDDETNGALDSKNSKVIIELFMGLNKENNKTMIIITH